MVNAIKTTYLHGLKKGFSSKFYNASRFPYETLIEGRRTHQLKRREHYNEDEDGPPITLRNKKNYSNLILQQWDELISDVLLWTPTYGQANVGRPARTYIQQLCEDTGCNPKDLPEAMKFREKWRERVRDIHASSMDIMMMMMMIPIW